MITYTNEIKKISYDRIIDIIGTSQYIHFKNNTLNNLINNFWNIYKCKDMTDELYTYYNHKLTELETK